ncbi:hypothetical protein [Ferrovum myxofaciens]|uniref:hypothetical protein n=1 Tax=Ferrovum myxofaciens TaxID=416213 RepID=UPI0023548F3F|nr:hypothetical protein [Ferrovum myxofaciens]MBU6995392.1 hypothetical protein [Ferrovum myxofaciens]
MSSVFAFFLKIFITQMVPSVFGKTRECLKFSSRNDSPVGKSSGQVMESGPGNMTDKDIAKRFGCAEPPPGDGRWQRALQMVTDELL